MVALYRGREFLKGLVGLVVSLALLVVIIISLVDFKATHEESSLLVKRVDAISEALYSLNDTNLREDLRNCKQEFLDTSLLSSQCAGLADLYMRGALP